MPVRARDWPQLNPAYSLQRRVGITVTPADAAIEINTAEHSVRICCEQVQTNDRAWKRFTGELPVPAEVGRAAKATSARTRVGLAVPLDTPDADGRVHVVLPTLVSTGALWAERSWL